MLSVECSSSDRGVEGDASQDNPGREVAMLPER